MTALKIIGLFLIILVAIGLYAWFVKIKPIWENVKFDFANAFKAIDLRAFSIKDVLISGQTKINPTLGVLITNENDKPISIKDMTASVHYNGIIVADTTKALSDQKITVCGKYPEGDPRIISCPNNPVVVEDKINIYLNKAGKDILLAKVEGGHPELTYVISGKIKLFGMWIPVSYEDKFTW